MRLVSASTRPASHDEILARAVRDVGLTATEDQVLRLLSEREATIQDIANAVGLGERAARRVAWRLVDAGYVLRVGDVFFVA